MKFPKNRSLIHWIAALAILLSALAPAVSQAISASNGGNNLVMDICSADGHGLQIKVPAGTSSETSASQEHCPYCVVHLDVAPPLAINLEFTNTANFAFFPALFYQSPTPLSAWVTPPSAAPPAQA
ncbi:Protein of unknown function [Polynucleobacter meluiroseus]|uniref:DUF2946 domain-containing protein n=1 Tax=Polynucleobacter meluiroseus TaxID=1938814 RepID=A0A240DYZ6_9BURK|nr:DUF2946 family protein [Polynucleobacter meluiroseus]SNX28243.1 Protein of unknown function [Polynucleobacter meluiroseus]